MIYGYSSIFEYIDIYLCGKSRNIDQDLLLTKDYSIMSPGA